MTHHKGLAIYIIVLHLALGLVLIKSDFLTKVASHLGALSPELTNHYYAMVSYHQRIDEQLPKGTVVFIGDSITQGLAVTNISPNAINFGIGSDTTVGVLQRLGAYSSLQRAEVIVLAIGVNDLKRRTEDAIIENYEHILNKLPAHTPVIVSALHPVDEPIWGGSGINQRITTVNRGLQRLTDHYDNRIYCDVGNRLSDRDGNLQDLFHTGDGIHLNEKGYQIWSEGLRAAIKSWRNTTEANLQSFAMESLSTSPMGGE
jgi:lysophospholipase L1-like esterase